MAFKIPDFTAVGFDDPRAVGGLPNYPKTDPGAEGLAALGKGVQQAGVAVLGIADDRQQKRDKQNDSTATLDLFTRLAPLQTKIAQETDTDKIAEYRTELNTLLQTSGQPIDNPDRLQAWKANHAKAILEAHKEADTRTTLLYRNKSTAASSELIDRVVKTGTEEDDPQAFEIARRGITTHLDYRVENGDLLPAARYEEEKRRTKELVEGRTLYLLGKDRPNEAKAFLDRHGGELDQITRGNFQLRIDGKVETLGTDAAANRGLGLAPALPARTAARTAGSMSVGGAIQGRISDPRGLVPYIREQAVANGIDPDVAVAVARSEGLAVFLGDGGKSGGAFQLYTGGGVGNRFQQDTGLDPLDQNNEKQTIDYALKTAAKEGWGAWNGAKKIGITGFAGIGGSPRSVRPIPTEIDAGATQPVAVAQPTPPNRTGLPSLAEAERTIYSDPTLTTDRARALAFEKAKSKYNAFEADAARAERIATEAKRAAVNARITEIQKDAYSDNPTIGARDIVNDPTFDDDPKMREHMIGFINNPPGSGIPAPQSYAAAQSIIDRIRLPEGDPNKITSRNQIYDMKGKLNRSDLDFSLNKFDELSAPGADRFKVRREEFFKGLTPQIDRSGVGMLGESMNDLKGKAKAFEFRRFVEDQIDQYVAAGKNPDDLINPKNSAYLGSTETMKPYKRTMREAMDDINADLAAGAAGAPAADKAKSPAFDLTTADGIKAAYRAGRINREQALKASIDAGFSAPAAASPPAAPQPPVPLAR